MRRPDWCCEALSPSTERVDRHAEAAALRLGVRWIWLVDPEARRVEVRETADGRAALVATIEGDARQAIPPFASELDAARWWLPTSR